MYDRTTILKFSIKYINFPFLATIRKLSDHKMRSLREKSVSFGKDRARKQSISQGVFQVLALPVPLAVKVFHINTFHC